MIAVMQVRKYQHYDEHCREGISFQPHAVVCIVFIMIMSVGARGECDIYPKIGGITCFAIFRLLSNGEVSNKHRKTPLTVRSYHDHMRRSVIKITKFP